MQAGITLTATVTNLTPGQRYSIVWYGYRSDDDPSPVEYSFTPPICPPSGIINVKAPYWPLLEYAAGDTLTSLRALCVLFGESDPVNGPDGQPLCLYWDLTQPYSPEGCTGS